MRKFYLMSDIHIDHLDDFEKESRYLLPYYNPENPILLTGDVSTARDFRRDIARFAETFSGQIYVVMGNHDYWGSSYEQMNNFVRDIKIRNVHICSNAGFDIRDGTAIVMVNNWYSPEIEAVADRFVSMNDWNHMANFAGYGITGNISDAIRAAQAISEKSAGYANNVFSEVSDEIESGDVERVVVMAHFPPYVEMMSRIDNYTPFYFDPKMGAVIRRFAMKHEHIPVTVVSGHTHTYRSFKEDNVKGIVAPANYGNVYMVPFVFDGDNYRVDQ